MAIAGRPRKKTDGLPDTVKLMQILLALWRFFVLVRRFSHHYISSSYQFKIASFFDAEG
jgi:hypothetical protein